MRRLLTLAAVTSLVASCNCGDNLKNAGAEISVTPLSIDFGTILSGSNSTRTVTIRSAGAHELTITRVTIESDARHAFTVGLAPTTIAPGSTSQLSVTYAAPLTEGPDGASLLIESDASGEPEVRVSLAGRSIGMFIEGGDSGTDAGEDAGTDAGFDAGTDAGPDAGTDAGEDAGTDAGVDAGEDAGVDGGTDAGAPPDGGEVIIDFEDYGTNASTFITPGYKGLTWDSDWYVFYTIAAEYQAHSGTNFITNDFQASPISFSFPAPVYFEGAWFSLDPTRNAHVWFELYDANNVLLGTTPQLLQDLPPVFLPVNLPNVTTVRVYFDVDFAMDDVTYIP